MTTIISNAAQNSIDWARAALEAHQLDAGIEGDDSIQVWHLILSLLVFCEVEGIDFDEAVKTAREHIADNPEEASR